MVARSGPHPRWGQPRTAVSRRAASAHRCEPSTTAVCSSDETSRYISPPPAHLDSRLDGVLHGRPRVLTPLLCATRARGSDRNFYEIDFTLIITLHDNRRSIALVRNCVMVNHHSQELNRPAAHRHRRKVRSHTPSHTHSAQTHSSDDGTDVPGLGAVQDDTDLTDRHAQSSNSVFVAV